MSGHSKWSTIKHKKGAIDAKRGKIFTKVAREIATASRIGGEDPNFNPRLRAAILAAKSVNMPADNIKRAIQKGSGGDKGDNYDEIIYEGYGPNQVAVIVECLSDNKNRTIASVRSIFNKGGGSLGTSNSVMYAFDKKGVIEVAKSALDEDKLTEYALDAGADDINTEDAEKYKVICAYTDLHKVQGVLEEKGVEIESSGIGFLPQNWLVIKDLEQAKQVMRFIDTLEDDDDVQRVHSNFDISPEVAAQLGEE